MEEEPVNIGRFLNLLRGRFAETVARPAIDSDEDRRFIPSNRLHDSPPFERMHRNHPIIEFGSRNQDRRVAPIRIDGVERRVGKQRGELIGVFVSVAIFGGPVSAGREAVEPQHIGDRHSRDHGPEQVGSLQHAGSRQ